MALRNPFNGRSTWPRWARIASSAWVVSPFLVFALLMGTFFAYGAYTRSEPTHYARGGDSFAVVPDSGSPSPTTATAHKHQSNDKHKAERPPAAVLATAPATSGQSSAAGDVPSGTNTTVDSGPVYPATGTYQLQVDGQEHVKFGPFSACSNTFPARSSLVIQPASGEPSGSYDFDQRFYPSKSNRHDERHIYRYTKSGVVLSFEQATVTCGGVKQSSSVNFQPAQLRVPHQLDAGSSWRTNGGDGTRTERGSFQVVGQESVTVGGHSYLTWVIDANISMTGDESGTREQRWWWSPDLAIPLKWHESLSGKRSGATYSEDVTVSVVGLP